jgi:osmotically-inducible protein OsmY
MGRSLSGVAASAVLVLLGTATVSVVAQVKEPAEQILPATDINRETNNPAKQAIKARQAQEKDKAQVKAAEEETVPLQPGPVADSAQLVQRVNAALRNDARTAKLGIDARQEEDLIALHGTVSSVETRAAVIDLAAKVAGATRIRSHLIVTKK